MLQQRALSRYFADSAKMRSLVVADNWSGRLNAFETLAIDSPRLNAT
jgi:hypothetical protein